MINACILVGCGSYSDKEIPDLAFAANDASAFCKTAISVCGIPEDNSYLLASGVADAQATPTRAEIIRILSKGPHVAKRMTPDTLFFLFSGHGFRSSETGIDYLLPEDAVTDALEDTALSLDFVIGKLRQWNARRTVLLLDACREKNGAKATIGKEETFGSKGFKYEGIATFSSCSPGEQSFETSDLGQGIFTAAVIEGLGASVACSTVYELDTFLQSRVPQLCHAHQKPSQHPYTVVEPLEMQGAVIVSEAMLRARQLANAIGRELREQSPLSVPQGGPCMIAMDFGTTSSAVAVMSERESQPEILPVSGQATLLASAVHFKHDLDYVVGKSALIAARTDKDHTILYPKRNLGMPNIAPLNLAGQTIGTPLASSLIIASLKATAEAYLQRQATAVYAAYPANYSTKQINALGEAFRLAGFSEIRLVTEPSIAALVATEFAVRETATRFLVIDLGGGTLDIAGVEASNGVVEVVAVGGDRALGGLDYDTELARLLRNKVHKTHPHMTIAPSALSKEGERIKIALGYHEVATALFDGAVDEYGEPTSLPIEISRAEAREAFNELDGRVLSEINQVVERMENDFNVIIFSGQGTKQFSLRHEIESRFKEKKIIAKHQETAVIRGLGEYLRVLTGAEQKILLLDTLPRSIAVECSSVRSKSDPTDFDPTKKKYIASFGASKADNQQGHVILGADTTVPARRSIDCQIIDPNIGAVFAIEERFTGTTLSEELMSVHLGPMSAGMELNAIIMDVEANHTILVTLEFADGFFELFQLNNLYKVRDGHELASESNEVSTRATVSGALRIVESPMSNPPVPL